MPRKGLEMTTVEIEHRIKKTIDQFFKQDPRRDDKEVRMLFIGGILQTALHILPNNEYFDVKQYCYDRWGYDPGGVRDGQLSIFELEGME